MGILDEAIREHLELKRQHGAGESELKQLEDEAFGQAERPGDEAVDPLAEAPTEFMAQSDAAEEEPARREPSIADLQEPPPPPEAEAEAEERQAIAEQPTELFEVEEELGEAPSPTDEELVDEEAAEPRLASPPDPIADLEEDEEAEIGIQGPAPDDDEDYEDEDDAFWNEQRLSDELDQALEGPGDGEAEPVEDEPAAEGDEEPAAESRPGDEDVLEETPDFLEETPEDDELWFEQKPPKDFDFDD
ncbi:MAG: hypothetical protein ACM3N0_05585 [Chloroflexota bacterium]